MKHFIILISTILLSSLYVSGQEINPIEGFRGLEWMTAMEEASFETMEDPYFNDVEVLGSVHVYSIPDDIQKLGTAELSEILYFFHENAGFFKVMLVGKPGFSEEMEAILENRLGKQYEYFINSTETHKIWNIGDVMVDYRKQRSQDFDVTITSTAISQWQEDKNETINDF